MKMMDINS